MRAIKSLAATGAVLGVAGLCSCAHLCGKMTARHVIVADGKAQAVIVTATNPSPVAVYAAQELVYHVEKATGVKLRVATETNVPPTPVARIYLGDSQTARAAGIDAQKLLVESCVLETKGNALFIVGRDEEGLPLNFSKSAGTLFGVYELLERDLGVRWLWPGDLGTYVPKTNSIAIAAVNETIQPLMEKRGIRAGGFGLGGGGGFSPEAASKYINEQNVFLRRHRLGSHSQVAGGHAFVNWWQLYGKEHPEWFQLVDGKRSGPGSMCVSCPGLHEQIVKLWLENRAKNPGALNSINACENDAKGICACTNCLAWDSPQPAYLPVPQWFGPRAVAGRYARFCLAVQQLAARHDPDVTVAGYAYNNYYIAPAANIKLNDHIYFSIVPDAFFPRSAKDQQWVKDQWAGWRHTGCRLFLRPNYMLGGYGMPHVFAHQFADEFKYAYANGLRGTDFDSLTGQWAVNGTTLYLLMRLHNRPEKATDRLLDEYYAGFGPAAPHVKAYFDYWEKYTTDNRERFEEVAKNKKAGWWNYAVMAHEYFPPAAFEAGAKILEQAQAAVTKGTEYADRVEFLRKGLEHATLTARVCGEAASPAARKALVDFRRANGKDGFANFDYCVWVENNSWPKLP